MPHTCVCPTCVYAPQGCTHPLYIPPYSSVHLYVLGSFVCCGGCKGLPFVLTLPLYQLCLGVPPLYLHPHTQLLVPCALVFQGYQYVMWAFSLLLKGLGVFLGVFPISWGFRGHQHLRCLYAHSGTFFVVHYVSHFYYGSNYYSSGYSGIFWPVISVVSDSGSFPDGVSSKLGSAWHGSTTTLDAERLWKCSCLSFCTTAANSIFNASSSLCQLCYGFSTGRFLF